MQAVPARQVDRGHQVTQDRTVIAETKAKQVDPDLQDPLGALVDRDLPDQLVCLLQQYSGVTILLFPTI